MNLTAWRNVIWKEWREQRMVFFALVAVSFGLHLWAIDTTSPEPDQYTFPCMLMLLVGVPLGSMFAAINVAAGERSRGTGEFLQSLPLSPRVVALVKLTVAVAVVFGAILATVGMTGALLRVGQALGWPMIDRSLEAMAEQSVGLPWLYWASMTALLTSVSLIVWVAALGVNSRSEVRAASIGLVAIAVLWALGIGVISTLVRVRAGDQVIGATIGYLASVAPGASGLLPSQPPFLPVNLLPLVGLGLLVHGGLAAWYIARLGRPGLLDRWSPKEPIASATPAWLGAPRTTPLRAMLWKHARQNAPVVISGAVGALLIGLTMFASHFAYADQIRYEDDHFLVDAFSGSMMGAFVTLGCCAALVIGAGTITTDLEPRLATFWRSRPISPNLWFATALGVGLLALLVVFGLPAFAARHLAIAFHGYDESHSWSAAVMVVLLLSSYLAAVFTASVVRNTVYACLLGLGLFAALQALFWCDWSRDLSTPLHALLVIGVLGGIVVASWEAVRRDWAILRS